ncbi:MAG: hypothetical protein AB7O65_00350, partial [Candidatus Korobacteraceae bacterium]
MIPEPEDPSLHPVSEDATQPPASPEADQVTLDHRAVVKQQFFPQEENPPWTLLEAVALAVLALTTMGAVGIATVWIAVSQFGAEAASELGQDPKLIVPVQFVAYLVVLGFMAALVRSRGVSFWLGIRWNLPAVGWPRYV